MLSLANLNNMVFDARNTTKPVVFEHNVNTNQGLVVFRCISPNENHLKPSKFFKYMKGPIVFRAVMEIVGKPKEHIEKTMDMYIDKIKKDPGLEVIKVDRPDAEDHEKDMFSVFGEVEVKAKSMENVMLFCFEYMPGSVEILEPAELIYKANEFTNFINDVQAKLHNIDMIVKKLSAENQILNNNGLQLMKNIVIASLEAGPKTLNEISKLSGMPAEHIKKFVNIHVKDGRVKQVGDKYSLVIK